MSVDHSHAVPAEYNDGELRYWYERYLKYSQELREDNSPRLSVFRYDEFKTWWLQLPDDVRHECMSDYRTGYNQLLTEASSRARAIIDAELLTPPFEISH